MPLTVEPFGYGATNDAGCKHSHGRSVNLDLRHYILALVEKPRADFGGKSSQARASSLAVENNSSDKAPSATACCQTDRSRIGQVQAQPLGSER